MRWLAFFCCASLGLSQTGTEPKAKPEDYEVSGRAGNLGIGAEFMIHSFSGEGQTYLVKDYLVVEVALYPPKDLQAPIERSAFALRINGKKQAISSVPPSMVAAALEHPEWRTGRTLEAGGGLGNIGVLLGGPPVNRGPYPGSPPMGGPPAPPRVPDPDPPGGIERKPVVSASELLVRTALPATFQRSVAGFVYFPYTGKAGSLKSVELIYQDAVIKLR